MIKKTVSRVFIIIISIAFLQVLGTLILARNLPKPEMGLFRLILTIVELTSIISLMGIDYSLVRFFSSSEMPFDKYNWKYFLKKILLFSALLIFIIAYAVSLLYSFNLFISLSIIFTLVMMVPIFILSSFLRAKKNYTLAIFFSRIHMIIFFLFLFALFISKIISFQNALFCYALSVVTANIIVVSYCLKNIPSGSTPIPFSVLKNGLYYFGIGISLMTILQAGPLFIAKMLSYKDVAIFAVIASIMRLFEFVQDSSYYVLAPHLNTQKNIQARKIFFIIASLAIAVASIYVVLGKTAVHLLFGGRYDEGVYLLPFFIGMGVMRTLYVLPASIIGGKSSEKTLRNQFYFTIIAAALNICLVYLFIQKWQLKGVALANIISWSVILIGSVLGTARYMKNIKIQEENSCSYT
ncbi:MAG: hypothetical protein KKB22_00680 [Candidatus Omnitrophica bacterium]|nr:hypothetical protein [Candidatus Omnitrophota bacterium]